MPLETDTAPDASNDIQDDTPREDTEGQDTVAEAKAATVDDRSCEQDIATSGPLADIADDDAEAEQDNGSNGGCSAALATPAALWWIFGPLALCRRQARTQSWDVSCGIPPPPVGWWRTPLWLRIPTTEIASDFSCF
ncbi:MAG: hypothetical protein ACI82G_002275 [Bradymonadia bacterium]|jgi:hypothetical protein